MSFLAFFANEKRFYHYYFGRGGGEEGVGFSLLTPPTHPPKLGVHYM
jgi:hypothetical protein